MKVGAWVLPISTTSGVSDSLDRDVVSFSTRPSHSCCSMVSVEPGFRAEVLNELLARGHELREAGLEASFAFGGAQLIYRLEDGYLAASDHRKDGQAVGF